MIAGELNGLHVGLKVRIRASAVVTIEDVLTQVQHFRISEGVRTRLWFETASFTGLFSPRESFTVLPGEQITIVSIDDVVEAAYKAAHPEFQPSDVKVGEMVAPRLSAGGTIGRVVDVREAGASLTVQWDNDSVARQNLASGDVVRLGRMAN